MLQFAMLQRDIVICRLCISYTYTLNLSHIRSPTIKLVAFTFAHVAVVKIIKVCSRTVINLLLTYLLTICLIKHTLSLFHVSNYVNSCLSYLINKSITQGSFLNRNIANFRTLMKSKLFLIEKFKNSITNNPCNIGGSSSII